MSCPETERFQAKIQTQQVHRKFQVLLPFKEVTEEEEKGRRRKRQEQVEDPSEERETSFSHFYLNILLPMTVLLLSLNGMSNKKRS